MFNYLEIGGPTLASLFGNEKNLSYYYMLHGLLNFIRITLRRLF
jgi:hypothetical protein